MRLALLALVVTPLTLAAQTRPAPDGFGGPFKARPLGTGAVKVGPPRGTVIVVGGGSMGPEVYKAFIDAAGGPDATILTVPNAGEITAVSPTAGQSWRTQGAKNVHPLFTRDRKIADSDSFTAIIRKAGGVWFEGGRQYHLVQDYGGTKTERAFMEVLERGGVVGGSSAGASILGDMMVRGAPSSNNMIMAYPGYEIGFGYLRNVGIDQHVVARSRLPDFADSITPKYPGLLGISEDEGTAWVIRGDTGRIIGRGKAFVYNGTEKDAGSPFLTLLPGDRYDLNARRIISRAGDRSPIRADFIASMFAKYDDPATGGATVLVAQDGEVYVSRAFGVPAQPRFMPRTTVPQFELGEIARVFTGLCTSMPAPAGRGRAGADSAQGRGVADTVTAASAGGRGRGRGGPPPSPLQSCITRVASPVGAPRLGALDSLRAQGNVDDLYRVALGFQVPTTWRGADYASGWQTDSYKGVTRLAAYATPDGKRAAFVRLPERNATIIILTSDAGADARGMSERIIDRLIAR